MTHYEKLAAMAFRIIGTVILIITLLSMALALLIALPSTSRMMLLGVFLPYLVGAIILFASSRLLAKLVCRGFDKSDE